MSEESVTRTVQHMSVFLDLRPIRELPQYRRLWAGQGLNAISHMMIVAALPYQVFHLTDSTLAVGMLGVVQLVPLIVFALVGGAFADSVDRKMMLFVCSAASTVATALLFLNSLLPDPQVWVLFVLGASMSAVSSASYPANRSLVPRLVPPELRPSAFALQSTMYSAAMMLGPAVAGALIGVGMSWAYGVGVLSFVFALASYARLDPAPVAEGAPRASLASFLEGTRFLRGNTIMLSVFGIDLLAMVFGMPRALFPALAERLDGGPALYGMLHASIAAGALLVAITSGRWVRVHRQGTAVIVAVAAWGLAIATAGLVRSAVVVLVLFAIAGGADVISNVYRATISADVVPDDIRGRVNGVEFVVYGGGPALGDVEAGVVGGTLGVPFAIVSGGVICVVGAALFLVGVPTFARYTRPTTEPAVSGGG
jgi:MFS family permease